MEGQNFIRCRERDADPIESIKDDAVAHYRGMMRTQVKQFESKGPHDNPVHNNRATEVRHDTDG